MTIIREADFVQSIADALQFISYYHPADYLQHLARAYEREQSPAAKDAIAQILTNSRMCAEGRRPLCQDTGIVNVFLKVGMDVRWDTRLSLNELVNEGVRRAYNHPDNKLRASVVADPAFSRRNTKDNTPAVVHTELVTEDRADDGGGLVSAGHAGHWHRRYGREGHAHGERIADGAARHARVARARSRQCAGRAAH